MNRFSKFLAPLALAGTVVPPLLFAFKVMGEGPMKLIMLVSTILWFTTARFWMKGGGQ